MRIALALILGIHGGIHLFGFLKAYDLAAFQAITQPIPRPMGLLWLLAFLLLTAAALVLLVHGPSWWPLALVGILLSQGLVLLHWSDARFGTLPNVLIAIAVVLAYGGQAFGRMAATEREHLIAAGRGPDGALVTEEMLTGLPDPVQRWLRTSGVPGTAMVRQVYLEQDLEMVLAPDQERWKNGRARQYFTTDPPAFHWTVDLKMNRVMRVAGRDKFEAGKGAMTIRLLGLIPMANAQGDARVDQATLQRYLAEVVWFPSAALLPWITWEAIDAHSARATMTHGGTEGSGIFHFDEDGTFREFTALRYKDSGPDAVPIPWTVRAERSAVLNGIRVPVELRAQWTLPEGEWTWLKLRIDRIAYDAGIP